MKNVIFDFGQVLVRFDPSYMVEKYVSDPVEAALLAHIVFDRKYWDRLDAGTISDAEVVADIKTRVPARLGDGYCHGHHCGYGCRALAGGCQKATPGA